VEVWIGKLHLIGGTDVDKKFETYQKFISNVIHCHHLFYSRLIAIENLLCLALYFVPLGFLEREIFMSLYPFPLCFCYLSGVLSIIVGHWFIDKNIFAVGLVYTRDMFVHAKFGTTTFVPFKTSHYYSDYTVLFLPCFCYSGVNHHAMFCLYYL